MNDPRQHPHASLLLFDPEFIAAEPDALFSICNGCGSAQAKFDFVPDSIYGLSITPACWQHDWDYAHGKIEADKRAADLRFLNNMLILIDAAPGFTNSLLRVPRRRRAMKYFEAVNRFGGAAFWAGKRKEGNQE